MHFWLNLPAPWRSEEFVEAAKLRGVLVQDAVMFAIDRQQPPHGVRISISSLELAELKQGLEIVRQLLIDGPDPMPLIF